VGGRIYLYAAVGDANGNPNYSARVTWTSSDTTVAAFVNSNDSIAAVVEGRQSGVATIYASSGGLTDTHAVQVVALGPVATVTVLPDSATVTLGDSGVSLQAVLRDSAGNVLNRGASWYTPDSLVLDVPPCGDCGGELVRGRASGVGTVFATRDGRTGRATIKVH
jgi:uncharacterized protein YjdB